MNLAKQFDRLRFMLSSPGNFARLVSATAANRFHGLTLGFGPRRVKCNLCGFEGRRFDYFLEREFVVKNSQCPGCGSQTRNRELILFIGRELRVRGSDVLDIAPAPRYREWFTAQGARYLSIDLGELAAMARMDITRLALPDQAFDLVICSHVLEHVPDYAAGLAEIRRVLRPQGVALIAVPLTKIERSQRLERPDHQGHVHVFGLDLSERIAETGFQVAVERYAQDRDPDDPDNQFFLARKNSGAGGQ